MSNLAGLADWLKHMQGRIEHVTRDEFTSRMMSNLDGDKDAEIERLRADIAVKARILTDQTANIDRLRKGIQDFLDGNYDNPRSHRPDKCPHDQYWYQGCDKCDEEHFTALLTPAD